METRKDRMAHEYKPKLHDYVRWHTYKQVLEGWVYYVDKEGEYITIEIAVKDKPHCEYSKSNKHCKIHVLVVCHSWCWSELEYVTYRKDYYDESHRDRTEVNV